uniref:Trichome birefringence-like N-terminal domain-containing protein n=1 Tax=Zea mays TaxID=4577 RepID=A0A804UK31_MAIZE
MLPSRRKSAVLGVVALSSSVLILLHAFSLPAASALSVGLARRHRHDATPGLAAGGCDVFSGSWVLDGGSSASAAYTGYNCPLIDAEFNCQLYGRPDSDYLRYLWKPAGCELPSLYCVCVHLQVRWRGLPDADEGEDGDVRGRLAGAQPVGVARLPAARRRAAVAGAARLRGPFVHLQVPGVPGDGILLPRAVPGGHRRGPGEAGADAGRHLRERRVVARRRRALLQLRPLVDAHRLDAGVGLHGRVWAILRGHGPHGGVPARPHHLGQLGGPQPRSSQDPCLLPVHVAHALQLEGMAQPGVEELLRRDGTGDRAQLDRPGLGPGPGDPGRAAGHEEPRPSPRHHGAVGDAEGRAPVGIQRRLLAGAARQPRRRLR